MLINSWLIVGKLCKVWGTVSLQATLYILVCSSDKYWCVLVTYIVASKYGVCMSRTSPLLTFKLSLGCLFSPHHVNQGGVQKTTTQVTLYKPHNAKESLRRRRAGRHSQVLPGHAGQAWELWHCHQRITHSMRGWPSRLAFLIQYFGSTVSRHYYGTHNRTRTS